MKHVLSYFIFLLLPASQLIAQTVVSIKVDGAINPVTADFIHNGIEKAKKDC